MRGAPTAEADPGGGKKASTMARGRGGGETRLRELLRGTPRGGEIANVEGKVITTVVGRKAKGGMVPRRARWWAAALPG